MTRTATTGWRHWASSPWDRSTIRTTAKRPRRWPTSGTTGSIHSPEDSWASPSRVPGVTTTSTTPSAWKTTTDWPGSSRVRTTRNAPSSPSRSSPTSNRPTRRSRTNNWPSIATSTRSPDCSDQPLSTAFPSTSWEAGSTTTAASQMPRTRNCSGRSPKN